MVSGGLEWGGVTVVGQGQWAVMRVAAGRRPHLPHARLNAGTHTAGIEALCGCNELSAVLHAGACAAALLQASCRSSAGSPYCAASHTAAAAPPLAPAAPRRERALGTQQQRPSSSSVAVM